MNNSGFTLLQLALTLVIIGLIVGGILTGRDLIVTAAQSAQIVQINKYNTAVVAFQTKYGGLPGDLALNLATQYGFQVAGCDGTTGFRDGNGMVDGYYVGQYIIEYGEALLFWSDLSTAGLLDTTFPNSGGSYLTSYPCGGFSPVGGSNLTLTKGNYYIGDFYPVAKIGQGNFIYVYDGSHPGDSCCGGGNWFGLAAITSVLANGGMSSNPGITVQQAYSIDNKIDDGLPTTGQVQATYETAWQVVNANYQASDSPTSCYNTTTNTYSGSPED